jgi:hypothetical protein
MVTVPKIRRKSPTDSGQRRRLCLIPRKCLVVSEKFTVAVALWLTYRTWCGGVPGPKTPRITPDDNGLPEPRATERRIIGMPSSTHGSAIVGMAARRRCRG